MPPLLQAPASALVSSSGPSQRDLRSNAVTCCPPPSNASNFSTIDTLSPTTCNLTTAQDAPEAGGVEQNAKGILEDVENHTEHDPSKSVTLGEDADENCTSYSFENLSAFEDETHNAPIGASASWPPEEDILEHAPWLSTTYNRTLTPIYEVSEWDVAEWDVIQDNETLRRFYSDRRNLVLDCVIPEIAPHIVITPADETWEDEYIPWQNRVDPQWAHYLCVPTFPLDFTGWTSSWHSVYPDNATPSVNLGTSHIPSPEKTNSITQSGHTVFSEEEMLASHKALCKDAFVATARLARVLRQRYDCQPNVLSNLEMDFTWTDPANPILAANRRMFGATILDSVSPFLAPHIIINAPPPQSYQYTENNTTPYFQDAAFGDQLVVETCFTEVINKPEHYISNFLFDPSTNSSTEDLVLENSDTESWPGTPCPGTPIDDSEHDLDDYRYMPGHDEEDSYCAEDTLAYQLGHECQSIYGTDLSVEAAFRAEKMQVTSRPMFHIADDEFDLPSLDDF
ncbi:hypothetical protein H0H93_000010 [Arthromyces matolae]|nr:hypothetical protein H0H93_000010 [Arthromyces matolae]